MLLAIDPGPHTGVAAFDNAGRFLGARTLSINSLAANMPRLYRELAEILGSVYLGAVYHGRVVCESFRTVTGQVSATQVARITAHVCGFIEGWCACYEYEFYWQTPAARLPFTDYAKALPHGSDHELSAIAHGLAWVHAHPNEVGRLIWDPPAASPWPVRNGPPSTPPNGLAR